MRLRPSRLELGPPVGYPVQFRVIGPDPMRLRSIAADMQHAIAASPHLRNVSGSWGQWGKQVTVAVDQDKARLLGLGSTDIANTLQTLQQGATVTQYREGTDLIDGGRPRDSGGAARHRRARRRDHAPVPATAPCRCSRSPRSAGGWNSRWCGGGTARRC